MVARRRPAEWVAAGGYVVVLLAAVVIVRAVEYFRPALEWFGDSAAGVAGMMVVAVAILVWLPYRSTQAWDRLSTAFFVILLAVWTVNFLLSAYRSEVVSSAVSVLPVALALLWLKRPSASAVRIAVDVLAWATAVLMVGVLLLQIVGVLDLAAAGTARGYDDNNYWLPLSGLIGFDGRWIGPLRTPNVTASAAVLLVVYGAARGWRERIAFVGSGVLVLLLTATRSSAIASVAGLAVLVLFTKRDTIAGLPKRLVLTVLAVGGLAFVAVWVARNPTLTGRTGIWPTYLELWRTSPVTGVGDPGVGLAVEAGRLPGWGSVGHSIFVDLLTRYGAVEFLLAMSALGIAAVLAWRAARAGEAVALALVVALVVGGITEALFDWRYLSFQVQLVIVVVLLASRTTWRPTDKDVPDPQAARTQPIS